jgi:transaldolase
MTIKLFYDGATEEEMLELNKNELIHGYTTNPTLMRKSGIENYEDFCKNLLKKIDKPISFEVFADDYDEMYRQAQIISSWAENVYVKIPITNTRGYKSNQLIRALANLGIKLNITAILTKEQIDDAIESLRNFGIISIFAGRIADCGYDPREFIKYAVYRKKNGQQILWASTRESYNIVQAEQSGADIITVPIDILKKFKLIGKDLKKMSLETVQMFYNDAKQSGYTL